MQKNFWVKEFFVLGVVVFVAVLSVFYGDVSLQEGVGLSPRGDVELERFGSSDSRVNYIEENGRDFVIEGEWQVVIVEDFETFSETQYYIYDVEKNERYRVYPRDEMSVPQISGTKVRIGGKLLKRNLEIIPKFSEERVAREIVEESDEMKNPRSNQRERGSVNEKLGESLYENELGGQTEGDGKIKDEFEKFEEELRFSPPKSFDDGATYVLGEISIENLELSDQPEILNVADTYSEVNLGEQKTAVVLVNFVDETSQPFSLLEVENLIFNQSSSKSVNYYVKELSYNQAFLSGEVYGWFTSNISSNLCYAFYELQNQAVNFIDEEVDFNDYKRLIIYFPVSSCVSRGTLGLSSVPTDEGVVQISTIWRYGFPPSLGNGDKTTVHELGHNFGVLHAGELECGNFIIVGNCSVVEYGDSFDPMGSGLGHYNSPHKDAIGWLSQKHIIDGGAPHYEYIIEPLETVGEIPKTIKIIFQNTTYYVEYRRSIGLDNNPAYFPPAAYDGALIYKYLPNQMADTLLLDNSPHNELFGPHFEDAELSALELGNTFVDDLYGVSISVLEATNEYLKIGVDFSECHDGIDNDNDGLIDYPDDEDCESLGDNNEGEDILNNTGDSFDVVNQNNEIVASFYENGNVFLAGELNAQSNCASSPSDSFIVRNNLGESVAFVDNVGNLCLKGVAETNILSCGDEGAFVIRGGTGTVGVSINQNGDLCSLKEII